MKRTIENDEELRMQYARNYEGYLQRCLDGITARKEAERRARFMKEMGVADLTPIFEKQADERWMAALRERRRRRGRLRKPCPVVDIARVREERAAANVITSKGR
jgi:hypothetical protein